MVGHIIVQELMILAGTVLAKFALDRDIPILYRNHEAKKAAPSGAALAESISTWLHGSELYNESAESTFRALLGRAYYSPTLGGHYGLAIPCYTNVTSPLRRYADLVNTRQVRAHLEHEPLPYSFEDLKKLGEWLGSRDDDRQEERRDGFKAAVQRRAQSAVHSGRLAVLADHELSQAVKLAGAGDAMPEVLIDELVRRFEAGQIADKVVDRLVATYFDRDWPTSVAAALAAWVCASPTRAVNLLLHATQAGVLAHYETDSTSSDSGFLGRVRLTKPGSDQVEFSGIGARKKDAEQAACVAAVCWLVGRPVPSAVEATRDVSVINQKSALMELCQKYRQPPPNFECKFSGPSHAPVFSCDASMAWEGRTFYASVSDCANKKEAESAASARLYSQVEGFVAHEKRGSPPGGAVAATSNPIGFLQELAQKNKWALPHYTVEQVQDSPPLFRATVEVTGPSKGKYVGSAASKKEAKELAAAAALGSS